MRPGTKAPQVNSERDLAETHLRRLLRALQVAHPVMLNGRERFIQVLTARLVGGRLETEIYLTGDPVPLHAGELLLAPRLTEKSANRPT